MQTDQFELGIIGGLLVSPSGRTRCNVYVRGGKVAALSPDNMPAHKKINAEGLLILPGMVDTHVHFMDPGDASREDFLSGTRAAAQAGVTTVVEHTHSWPIRNVAELKEKLAHLTGRSQVDYGLAAHVWPEYLDQVEPLWLAGVDLFKIFTCATHGVPAITGSELRDTLCRVSAVNALALVHAEDNALTSADERRLRTLGRTDPSIVTEWRSPIAERIAVAQVTQMARWSKARVIVAHASSSEVIDIIGCLRGTAQVFVETCPQYLFLLEDEVLTEGALRKFTPPARARSVEDLESMWDALRNGKIDYVSSDHAPSTRKQKETGTIWDAPFGLPGIDTSSRLMLDAALQGRISLETLVELYSASPARIHGLYPKKGNLGVGADADIVLVDPQYTAPIDDASIASRAGWTPYRGRIVRGKLVNVILRGLEIVSEGSFSDRRAGRFLRGPGARVIGSDMTDKSP